MTLTRDLDRGDDLRDGPWARRPEERVVLVDAEGLPAGTALKSVVHTTETPRHLAFSLHLFDGEPLAPETPVLLTRRALDKKTWPGVWTNSCCGHPGPDETTEAAIRRRVGDELGVPGEAFVDLRCVLPEFAYQATDATGIRENELCPVYVARLAPGVHPERVVRRNPAEVSEWAWVAWSAATRAIVNTPFAFSPWAVGQVEQLSGRTGAPGPSTGGGRG